MQYIEKSTGRKLLDDKKSTEEIGKEYETEKENIKFYKYIDSTDNTKGTYKLEDQKVIYYYEKLSFNFSVDKKIAEVKINGKNIKYNSKLSKVEIDKNDIKNTNLEIKYNITVKNTGELAGKCKLIEKIPEGFVISDNSKTKWIINDNNLLQLQVEELQVGEERTYEIILKWDNSQTKFGTFTNTVKIYDFENEPGFDDINSDDNKDDEEFIVAVKTGLQLNTIQIELIILVNLVILISICIKIYYTRKKS